MAFTSLAYQMDFDWLIAAYRRTRKDGAAGVDGVIAAEYEQDLLGNLQRLLDRVKSGTYRAPPVRRVYIPKGNSKTETRPVGIPTLEDKILQRAVVVLLEPIYKHDSLDCSYGFRPGRSAHEALQSLQQQTMDLGGGLIFEVDIRKFSDNLNLGGHQPKVGRREFLRHRMRDGVLLRLIGKWLKAGVMKGGSVSYPDTESPQGGVVSPLLANVFLHYVLDLWFHQEVLPRLHGPAFLIRYADDFIIGFGNPEAGTRRPIVPGAESQRVMEVLPKRFGKYGLTIHPDKTRLVPFQRPSNRMRGDESRPESHPGTFDFLGFTHY